MRPAKEFPAAREHFGETNYYSFKAEIIVCKQITIRLTQR